MAIGACERDRDGSAALIDDFEVYLRCELSPIGGILAGFLTSQRGGAALGIHRLPPPTDPIALLCVVVLGHPFDQLLEDTHSRPSLCKRSWMTLEDTPRTNPDELPCTGSRSKARTRFR